MLPEVLIAGGGIGGLATALACRRAGCRVRLYERAPEFTEIGAGIQLGPNVVRVLRDWGLEATLAEVVARPDRVQARRATDGVMLANLPLADFPQRYGAPYFSIHRADLHTLLLDALRREQADSLWLYRGRTLEAYEASEEAVRVRLDDGLEVEGDLLIGADGLWSRVRAQLLGDGPPSATGHLAYRALVRQAALPATLRSHCVTVWLGPGLHVVVYPVRGGDWLNVVALVEGPAPADPAQWDNAANAADLKACLAGTCAPLRELVAAVPAWRLWALNDRPPVQDAAQMAQGRVALLGDAAHPMRPYLAQGAGMAIEDADELGRLLGQARELGALIDTPLLLQRYALNRWQRNASVQARAARNGRLYHLRGPAAWARDTGLRLLGARLMDQPWLYGAA
ncbi:FAD-dependent oxidoreductase [Hylemonella gracilis]|uniref:FAD-dependent oxidoreductase n=1 Tax=Hylemonella gracilis TaxID=80880 RepID=A0A4V1A2E4_9BURK|nr:FAD-dependent monooxygenase [Hylemonella gracilis]QBK05759.1 FAD-dependent oxidoreductase [Hylemonella gracilis]